MQISISNSIGGSTSTRLVLSLIQAFKTRVAADSAVYEAETCQVTTLTNLNKI